MSMTESEAISRIKYRIDTASKAVGKGEDGKAFEDLELAINALEKQIPKKPKEYEDKFYACPICGNVLLHKWKKYNTKLTDKSNGLPYCLNCGQAIDWSVKNE